MSSFFVFSERTLATMETRLSSVVPYLGEGGLPSLSQVELSKPSTNDSPVVTATGGMVMIGACTSRVVGAADAKRFLLTPSKRSCTLTRTSARSMLARSSREHVDLSFTRTTMNSSYGLGLCGTSLSQFPKNAHITQVICSTFQHC